MLFGAAHVHRDLGPVLAAFVWRADQLLLGQRRVKRLDGGDLWIVDIAIHPGRHHAVGLDGQPVRQFDQAGAVDRMAESPAHLEPDFVILERLLPVRGHQHPDAGINVCYEVAPRARDPPGTAAGRRQGR